MDHAQSLADNPALFAAMVAILVAAQGAVVALLLLVQTWAQEKKRKLETESAREKMVDATSTRVVEKLIVAADRTSPTPAATPAETPDAKRDTPTLLP